MIKLSEESVDQKLPILANRDLVDLLVDVSLSRSLTHRDKLAGLGPSLHVLRRGVIFAASGVVAGAARTYLNVLPLLSFQGSRCQVSLAAKEIVG